MDFEKAVSLVGTVTDLRRIASAHVIDHNQLKDEELRMALVKSKPRPQLISWLEHQGEHYGKLVTAYRANGVVPPVSRPK